MEYTRIKGLDKPVSKLLMGTAWFNKEYKEEIFQMLDLYIEKGGTVIDTGRFYGAHYQGKHACESERILKEYFDSRGNRDQLVIMDKAWSSYYYSRWSTSSRILACKTRYHY